MELVIKKLHMPWPGIRLVSGQRLKIEPDTIAEALVRRGFAERIAPDILAQEQKTKEKEKKERGK